MAWIEQFLFMGDRKIFLFYLIKTQKEQMFLDGGVEDVKIFLHVRT